MFLAVEVDDLCRDKDGQCLQSFSGHLDGLNFVSWASALLTASVDRTARLWTEEPKVFEHPNEVNSAREHKARLFEASLLSFILILINSNSIIGSSFYFFEFLLRSSFKMSL